MIHKVSSNFDGWQAGNCRRGKKLITGVQIRAARALLSWSQSELARRAGVSLPTIKRLEAKANEAAGTVRTNESIRLAVEANGIVFIGDDDDGGRGVRLGRRDRTPKSG